MQRRTSTRAGRIAGAAAVLISLLAFAVPASAATDRTAATNGTAATSTTLTTRPPGYRPGEELASVVAQNQDGETVNIRDTIAPRTWTLIDVCAGWCGPCAAFAKDTQRAIVELAAVHRVQLRLTTLLLEGETPGSPSTQDAAQRWKQEHGLTGDVLHAGGDWRSELARAAVRFVFDESEAGALPTHLLVDPKGTIVDRRIGAEDTAATVARVLTYAKKIKAPKAENPRKDLVGTVGLTLPDGSQHSAPVTEFDAGHETPYGTLFVTDYGSTETVAQRSWSFLTRSGEPLATTGPLGLSYTPPKGETKWPIVSPTLRVVGGMMVDGGMTLVTAGMTLPATVAKDGTVSVDTTTAELRAGMRAALEQGQYSDFSPEPYTLRPEDIDGLVASLFFVQVEAQFTVK